MEPLTAAAAAELLGEALIPKELAVLAVAVMVALGHPMPTRVFKAVPQGLPTQAAVVALVTQAVQASSLFVTSALNAAQAALSHQVVASPTTPSHRPARSRHKEKTWHILQK
jgi:hypothetical protein